MGFAMTLKPLALICRPIGCVGSLCVPPSTRPCLKAVSSQLGTLPVLIINYIMVLRPSPKSSIVTASLGRADFTASAFPISIITLDRDDPDPHSIPISSCISITRIERRRMTG